MTPAQNTAAYIQGFEDGKRTAKAEFAKLLLEQSPQPKEPEQEPVAWGVDWGRAGDIPCVSIIKRLPNGGIEVVAVEYAPYTFKEKNT